MSKSKKSKATKPNKLHDTLVRLLSRPDGATLHDTWNAGYYFPAVFALKLAERRGYKTSIVKKKGELTRYKAVAARRSQ
jgi:hypothetical protein